MEGPCFLIDGTLVLMLRFTHLLANRRKCLCDWSRCVRGHLEVWIVHRARNSNVVSFILCVAEVIVISVPIGLCTLRRSFFLRLRLRPSRGPPAHQAVDDVHPRIHRAIDEP